MLGDLGRVLLPHLEHPSGSQSRWDREAGAGMGGRQTSMRGMSLSETIKSHLINPIGSVSAGCCFPFATFPGDFGDALDCPGNLEKLLP